MSRPNFDECLAPPERFWGKLSRDGWHPLLAHCADVAAVMSCCLSPGSTVGRRLARLAGDDELSAALRARLVFLAACHDLGKVNHGFQGKARPAERPSLPVAIGHFRELLESLRTVPALRELVLREALAKVGPSPVDAGYLFGAAIAHHGQPLPLDAGTPGLQVLWQPPRHGRDPLAEAARLVRHARAWAGLDGADEPLPDDPAFSHLFAGLVMLADWVGSTRTAFPFAPWADEEPDRYWREQACPRAVAACAQVGLVPRTRPVSLAGLPLLETLFPATFPARTPTPLQRYIATLPLPAPGARLLLESETGSGKTEAALTLYARLRAAGLVGGLFFALPTRATATAMFARVCAALDGLYEGEERPSVALAVGGSQPRGEASPLLAETPARDDDPGERDLSRWASERSKAFLAAEVVVGTLDQALLAALPVKHAHLRLAALSRHLLVVDELHSYDRYMTTLLEHLLALLGAAGGLSLCMSATLSHAARRLLGGGPARGLDAAVAQPYPCVSVCERGGAGWVDTELASLGQPRPVAWRHASEAEARDAAVAAARAGARVLWVRNTVRAARAAVAELVAQGHADLLWRPGESPHRPPYHARYAPPDRLALDRDVLARFGKAAALVGGGCLLVATQVAEQSLDVDFDLLVTDLCPVDVLLQRAGRAHRHRERDGVRPRAYADEAQVLVVSPEGGFSGRLGARYVEVGWGERGPYDDYRVAELTWRLVGERPRVTVPGDNRALIEAVYHPEQWARLDQEEAWRRYAQGPELRRARERFVAGACATAFGQRYADCHAQFGSELVEYRTRLGDDQLQVDLREPLHCWYAQPSAPVLSVDLPHWLVPRDERQTTVRQADPRPPRDGATCIALGPRVCWYGPAGWEWDTTED